MRSVTAQIVGGVLVPDGGYPGDDLLRSLQTGGEFRFFERGAVPLQDVTPASTVDAATLAVYRQFYSRPDGRVLVGATDYIPTRGIQADIAAICGGASKFLSYNYDGEVPSGATATAAQALLNDHVAAGGYIGICAHPKNFVTGGDAYDRTSTAVSAIKPGGARHAAYRTHLDQLATFIDGLNGAPVIYRPLHEMNGDWFWWNGADRAADLVLVWQDTVTYLRGLGLTNILYSWNINGAVGNGGVTANTTTAYSTWWPGAEYVDMISMDLYDSTATPVLMSSTFSIRSWNALLELAERHKKPIYIAEIGSSTGAQDIEGFWTSKVFDCLDSFPGCAAVCVWNLDFAPSPATVAAPSFADGVSQKGLVL